MDSSNYAVSDIYFAAFLRTSGCKLVSNERRGNRTTFFFENGPDFDGLKNKYFNKSDDVLVSPLDFANNVKDLKSMCYMS